MKTIALIISLLLSLSLLLTSLVGCGEKKDTDPAVSSAVTTANNENLMGGWQVQAEKVTLRNTVQKAFDTATEKLNSDYTPVAYLGSQVVAGSNYAVLCKGPTENNLQVIIIYAALNGSAEVTHSTPLQIGRYNTGKINTAVQGGTLSGGWAVTDESAATLPDSAEEAFEKAADKLSDCTVEPLALLASQVVAGQNYAILCRVTDKSGNTGLKIAVIYAALDGSATFTAMEDFSVADFNR